MTEDTLPVILLIVLGLVLFAIPRKWSLTYIAIFRLILCAFLVGYFINEAINGNGTPATYILIIAFLLFGAYVYYRWFIKRSP